MGKKQQDGKTTKVKLAKDDLAYLVEATKYTKSEIKEWYRSFRKECPAGVLRKADLHSMYLRYGNYGNTGCGVFKREVPYNDAARFSNPGGQTAMRWA